MLVASSTLAGINFITTIAAMRAPGMGWMQMPLFTWSILVSIMCLFISIPAFGIGLIEALLDRTVATAFFNVSAGGDPVLSGTLVILKFMWLFYPLSVSFLKYWLRVQEEPSLAIAQWFTRSRVLDLYHSLYTATTC
jgi:hypothetical protein